MATATTTTPLTHFDCRRSPLYFRFNFFLFYYYNNNCTPYMADFTVSYSDDFFPILFR